MEYAPARTRKAIKVIWSLHDQRQWTLYDIMRVLGCSRTLAQRIAGVLVKSRTAYIIEEGGGRHKTTRYGWTIDQIIARDAIEATTGEIPYCVPDVTDTPTHSISTSTIQSKENKLAQRRKINRKRRSKDVLTAIRERPDLAREPIKPYYPFWRDIMRRLRCGLAQQHVPAHIVRAATGMLARMYRRIAPTVERAVEIATEIYRALCAQARLTVQRVRWIIGNVVRRLLRGKCARARRQIDRYYTTPQRAASQSTQRTPTTPPQREELPRERRATGGINTLADLLMRIFGGETHDNPPPPQRKMTTTQVLEWYQHLKNSNAHRT
jgi:hypothetical protein